MLTKDIPIEKQIIVVKTYLNGGQSIRARAKKVGIHYITLWRWVKQYRVDGEEGIKRKGYYRRPWNRPSKEIEEKVVFLKENNPSCTLRSAQKMLEKDGIKMSIKGIWSIWKRYALTGRSKSDPYARFGPLTPEIKDSLEKIKELLKEGMVEEASGIVNSLPSFPKDPVLREIPEELLTPRRQLDRLYFLFCEIPFPEYYRKAKKIRKALERKGLFYSSIFAGLRESLALTWMTIFTKELELITLIKKRAKGIRGPSLRYLLSGHEAMIYSRCLNAKKAKARIRECIKLLRFLPHPFFFGNTVSLLSLIADYKNASLYCWKALEMETDEDTHRILLWQLALLHAVAGRYRESITSLRGAEKRKEGFRSSAAITRAFCAFGKGDLLKASFYFEKTLEESEQGNLRSHLHEASLGLACIQAALGKEKEAKIILRKYLPFFRKHRMEGNILIRNILLRKVLVNEQIREFPTFNLLSLLQNNCKRGDYQKALRFAKNNDLSGFFHRIILFFPEPVRELLEKGKPTGLPRSVLNLPIFRKEIPVYSVKFLGHLIVYKNQKYLKVKLSLKDTSFLIDLSLSRQKSISLDRIYSNFWPNSKYPSRNLAHLLVRIRKALRLPSHYLYVKKEKLFFNCYFTTDYGEYTEHLAQAKALERAGEWGFAKKEYLRAFALFRGEPFKKMYDNWSDDKRLEILFSYETEVLSFAKELISRGRTEEAKKLLKKAEKILPYSDEIKELSRE